MFSLAYVFDILYVCRFMYLEFVKGRVSEKHLEIKEFTCNESLQENSSFGRTGLLKKIQVFKGRKSLDFQGYFTVSLFMVEKKLNFLHVIFISRRSSFFSAELQK